MLRKIRKKIAQSTLEYAVLVVVVIGALLSIQAYLKRGIMGKMKTSTDESISAEQYDPQHTNYMKYTNTLSHTNEASTNVGSFTNLLGDETTNTIFSSNTNTQ